MLGADCPPTPSLYINQVQRSLLTLSEPSAPVLEGQGGSLHSGSYVLANSSSKMSPEPRMQMAHLWLGIQQSLILSTLTSYESCNLTAPHLRQGPLINAE